MNNDFDLDDYDDGMSCLECAHRASFWWGIVMAVFITAFFVSVLFVLYGDKLPSSHKTQYCPHCGAKIESVQN